MRGLLIQAPLIVCALFVHSCGSGSPFTDSPPAILLITIDSFRPDRLGFNGHKGAATPNIDALARDALRFTQAQTPSPLSTPALAALHTGRYPSSTGVRLNERHALADSETTLAEVLQGAGYRTGAVAGSLLLHSKYQLDQGFEEYMLAFDAVPRPREVSVVSHPASRVVDRALEWLETAHRQQFFLWVNFHDPHYFYSPPPPFSETFIDQPYDGEIAYVDAEVGRLLEGLKGYGIDERTMIILTSSHGEGLMDHGETGHGTLLYQTTLAVPLIMRPANRAAAGRREIDLPVSLIDLMPTILEAAQIPEPEGLDGRSLAAAFRGESIGLDPERPLFAETLEPMALFGWKPLAAVRSGRWKYIDSTPARLFDLLGDPGEENNVAAEYSDVVFRLAGKVAHFVRFEPTGCASCGELAEQLGLVWPPGYALGREIDAEERIEVANDAHKAHRSLRRKMAQTARLIYEDILEQDPQNRIALIELALISGIAQDTARSKELFTQAQRLYPDDTEIYHLLGHLALAEPVDSDRATALFSLAVALDPLNEEALYDAACGVSLQGDTERALDLLERAIGAGFRDFSHMKRDTDLDPIRSDPRFRKLVPE